MVPIPHGVPAWLAPYGPALLTLAVSLAASWFCQAKGRQPWRRTAISLACLLGWAALEPMARLRGAVLAPAVGPGMLIVPAASVLSVEAIRVWRRGRNERWLSVAPALITGWWLARVAAGPGEFWRVGVVVALLVWVSAWVMREQTARGTAAALALWGGTVVTGWPIGWEVATAALASAWAGLFLLGAEAAVPSAITAATLAGADLARGRLPRGHVGAADVVCLLALAAPFLAAALEARLGKRWRRLAPALGAAGAVALGWGLRRAVF